MARPTYEITGSNGVVYEIEANNDAQAEKIARFIEERIAAGDPELREKPLPNGGIVEYNEEPLAEDTSAGGAFARGMVEGGTLNWGDELSAFMNTAVPGLAQLDNLTGISGDQETALFNDKGFWDTFESNLAEIARKQRADEAQHSGARSLGNLTGAVGTGLAVGPRAAKTLGNIVVRAAPKAAIPVAARISATRIGSPVLTSAAEGTAIGTAAGGVAGAGAGNDAESRAKSAKLGAFTGGAMGAGIGATVTGLGPAIRRYWNVLSGRNSEEEATRQLITALERDGYDVSSPEGVQAIQDELSKFTGKQVTLADIGPATRARAGVGLRAPSQAQTQGIDFIRSRQAGQGERLTRDIRETVSPRTDIHTLDEELVRRRAEDAEVLRERALFEDSPTPEVLYRGGAPFNPEHPNPSFFTPDKEAAESYVGMHEERFQTPGVVESFVADLENPIQLGPNNVPSDDIIEMARRAGIDEDNIIYGTTSSWFDPSLNPPGATQRFITELRNRGYDGARTLDVPWSGSGREEGKYIEALVPFSNKAVKPYTGSGVPSRRSRIVEDPTLQGLARLPDAQRALTAALDRARSERDLRAALGQPIDDLPDLTRGANLDVRTLDYLKRFLDDEVNTLFKGADTSTFKAAQAHQVKGLRDAIRERMKIAVPEYGEYLETYKGSSDLLDALRSGRDYRKLDPEQIAAEQADRTVGEQELYRTGVARDLIDQINDTRYTGNAASKILASPEADSQLAAVGIPSPSLERLRTSVAQERQLNQLPVELAGSQTQQRIAAAADADAGAHAQLPFNPGSPLGWLGAGIRNVLNRASTTRNAAVNEALLPRILESDPRMIEEIIRELEETTRQSLVDVARRQRGARRASGVSGLVIGAPVALPSE